METKARKAKISEKHTRHSVGVWVKIIPSTRSSQLGISRLGLGRLCHSGWLTSSSRSALLGKKVQGPRHKLGSLVDILVLIKKCAMPNVLNPVHWQDDTPMTPSFELLGHVLDHALGSQTSHPRHADQNLTRRGAGRLGHWAPPTFEALQEHADGDLSAEIINA